MLWFRSSALCFAVACRMVDFLLSQVYSLNRQSSSFLFISSWSLLQDGLDVAYLRRDTRYSLRSDPIFSPLPFAISFLLLDIFSPHTTEAPTHPAGVSCFHCLVGFGLLYFYAHKMVLLNDSTHFLAFDESKKKKNSSVWNVNDVVHKNVESMAGRYPVAS